ncbi:PQQ-binding-like beta-propeller repeat protein [Parahaliea maris]|uniref:PQQ-binding-like beta-propeller repeat protein n=1 Tax=Parahaliea maris TaxID=2716870 RepID=A0A5C8ZU11_9GAMM|nr:PQQ-binding-like beta-propeller repeat protein [Parahaliea maris]TXS91274.1 PQQ-binding-like beta-propeller repeat protein [Parahaliea maris]
MSARVTKWLGNPVVISAVSLVVLISSTSSVAGNNYSPGGWPTLHKDAGNRRSSSAAVTGRDYNHWTALAGASVLTAPVTSPDGQQLYLTTGLPRGHANLHAVSIDGSVIWESSPWTDADQGVDPCAILSSPIVDSNGDIYISDCNQLFAFASDGTRKWVTPLPALQEGDWVAAGDHPVNAFTTAAFTADGDVMGVTNFGDVVITDRDVGAILNAPFRLPAVLAPYASKHRLPDSLLSDGLMDPAFREWAWQVIFAGNMRSANTPAVSSDGRIFVVGSSNESGIGALFALDVDSSVQPYEVSVAFSTRIGIGSGSSPALSPSEQQVYVSDEEGWLYAIDSDSGKVDWKVKTAAAAGAAAVGPDGTVYALQEHPAPAVIAVSPRGEILWESDASPLLRDLPGSLILGDPVAVANGNPAVAANAILVPVLYGYALPFTAINLPFRSTVIALDPRTGKATGELVDLADDSSGITAVLPDGTLVNSLGSTITSAISPLRPISNLLLPEPFSLLEPRGGVQVSVPADNSP